VRLGLYGGTFDPIHSGHLIIAQFVQEELNLDSIVFIPSGTPPHKRVFAANELRLRMVEAAIAGNAAFQVSGYELEHPGVNYSVDTIVHLQHDSGVTADRLHWIIGSDNFVQLQDWHEPERLLQHCRLVVFPRNNVDHTLARPAYLQKAQILTSAPQIDISSTLVRQLVRKRRSIRYLVPPSVNEIIRLNNLYIEAES